ncbi:(Fe-S)-binding protein, partial [Candidatus Woesearchaeota archaeon]
MSEREISVDFNRMHDPKPIIELIVDNLRKTKNPLGLSNNKVNTWWKDVGIKREGKTILFTGLLYQMVPYIENLTLQLEKYETSTLKKYIGAARYIPKFMFRMLYGKPISEKVRIRFDNIIKNIAKMLMKTGVDFCYKPEVDGYSGILLYDLGDIDEFVKYVKHIVDTLRRHDVKTIITIDPHTTYALKVLVPEYLNEDFDVRTYFEVLKEQGVKAESSLKVTIHDPCFYGRYLKLSDVVR